VVESKAGAMRIQVFHNLDEINPRAEDWDRLALGIPFRGWTWLSNWWRHYQSPGRRLAVLGVFDSCGALVGIAPWFGEASALHGRVLRPLGSGEVCSDYLSVLCQPGDAEVVAKTLAEFLIADRSKDIAWDLLELLDVDAEDRVVPRLVDHMADLGAKVHRRSGAVCWRMELPERWDDYVAALKKKMRQKVRGLAQALWESGSATFHVAEGENALPWAMDLLVDLHQRRRRMLGEPGCFASPRFLGFFRDVAPALMRTGQVRFFWLEIDGRPAAVEYQLAGNNVMYAYQSGALPEAFHHQPGNLLNLATIRHAIEQGYRAYDFLRGDEPYKARFGARPRPSVEYRVVPRRPIPRLRHGLWRAGTRLKQWAKRDWGLGTRDGGQAIGIKPDGVDISAPSPASPAPSSESRVLPESCCK